jgi:preprotein translocase subunit SecA
LQTESGLEEDKLRLRVLSEFDKHYREKTAAIGAAVMRLFEKAIMLQVLDSQWKDHLAAMDYLRQGIHLRGYAQKNPKEEYKREAFALFSGMLVRIKHDVISLLARLEVRAEADVAALAEQQRPPPEMHYLHPTVSAAAAEPEGEAETEVEVAARPETVVRSQPKVGRNQPCPCGSGKKYKHCHGQLA